MKIFKPIKLFSLTLCLALLCSFAMPVLAFASEGEAAPGEAATGENQESSTPQSSEIATKSVPVAEAPPDESVLVPNATSTVPASMPVPAAASAPAASVPAQESSMASEVAVPSHNLPANADVDALEIKKIGGTVIDVKDAYYNANATLTITGAVLEDADWTELKALTNPFHLVLENENTSIPSNAMSTRGEGNSFIGSPAILSFSANNITSIASINGNFEASFRSCTNLETVSLPNATVIGSGAFAHCPSLKTINLPEVETLQHHSFYSCTSLEITDLLKVTSISNDVFNDCKSLKIIELPKVTYIGSNAFYDCTKLESYIFGATLPTVDSAAVAHTPSDPLYYYTGTDEAFASFTLDDSTHTNITRVNLNSTAITPAIISLARGSTQQHNAGQTTTTGVLFTAPTQLVTWQLSGSLPVTSSVDESGLVSIGQLEQNANLTLAATVKIGVFEKVVTAAITVTNPYVVPSPTSEITDPNKPDPNKPDPNNPDPNKPDPNIPDPNIPDPNIPDPNIPDPNKPDPNIPDPNIPDPNIPDPNKPDPAETPAAPEATALVSKVKFGQAKITLVAKKAYTPAVLVYTSDKSKDTLTWKSSNAKIAKVTAGGKITAVKKGTAKITATASNGKKAVISVTVVAKAVKNAKVKTVKAAVPKSMKVKAVKDITGTYAPLTVPNVRITYKSSNAKIASIDKAGRITAKKAGTVKITVKAGGVSKVSNLTVKK